MPSKIRFFIAGLVCLLGAGCAARSVVKSTLTLERERLLFMKKTMQDGGTDHFPVPTELVVEDDRIAATLPLSLRNVEVLIDAVETAKANGQRLQLDDGSGAIDCDAFACTLQYESTL